MAQSWFAAHATLLKGRSKLARLLVLLACVGLVSYSAVGCQSFLDDVDANSQQAPLEDDGHPPDDDGPLRDGSPSNGEESSEGVAEQEAGAEEAERPADEAGDAWADAEGPLVIRSGGTYSGSWVSLDPSVAAVTVLTDEPVVIENARIWSMGIHISAPRRYLVDVTIRNVVGEAIPHSTRRTYPGRFLHVERYRSVTVENSAMIGTSGIYLHNSEPGATVKILRNRAINVDGRRSDGAGGHDGFHRVQFVQFNLGVDLVDTEVAWNEVINHPYESRVEDVISLFRTRGRADDPVRIHNNFIWGAYPADPAVERYSGGGIMLGDGGGAYLHAYENTVVNTSNYGIAISGGHDNVIRDNRVVSCGLLPDGRSIASQNVGIYIWNQYRSSFHSNVGHDNVVAWARPDGKREDWWVPDASDWTGNVAKHAGRAVSCDVESAERAEWEAKVSTEGIVVGPISGAPFAASRAALD